MSDEDIGERLTLLEHRHHALERRISEMVTHGTVKGSDYSDPTKPRARIVVGTNPDGSDVLGPMSPVSSFAGSRVIHAPVADGQQMVQISLDGHHEGAVLIPLGFSQPTPSPSTDPNSHVDQFGKSKDTLQDGARKIEWDGGSLDMTSGKLVITANHIALVGNVFLGADGASRELALRDSIDSHGDTEQENLSTKVRAV